MEEFTVTDTTIMTGESAAEIKAAIGEGIEASGGGSGNAFRLTLSAVAAVGLRRTLIKQRAPVAIRLAMCQFLSRLAGDDLEQAAEADQMLVATNVLKPHLADRTGLVVNLTGKAETLVAIAAKDVWDKARGAVKFLNQRQRAAVEAN